MTKEEVCVISLFDEDLTFRRKDGVVTLDGYDIENERMALALAGGFATGSGSFLIALNELVDSRSTLNRLLTGFQQDIENRINKGTLKRSSLYYLHGSYSPLVKKRLWVIRNGVLPDSAWKRLLHDPEPKVALTALTRARGPIEELRNFALSGDEDMRIKLAMNTRLSDEILLILSDDPSQYVLKALGTTLKSRRSVAKELTSILIAKQKRDEARVMIRNGEALLKEALEAQQKAEGIYNQKQATALGL